MNQDEILHYIHNELLWDISKMFCIFVFILGTFFVCLTFKLDAFNSEIKMLQAKGLPMIQSEEMIPAELAEFNKYLKNLGYNHYLFLKKEVGGHYGCYVQVEPRKIFEYKTLEDAKKDYEKSKELSRALNETN